VKDYLATLDDTAWGAATDVVPKFVSPSDPAAQWTPGLTRDQHSSLTRTSKFDCDVCPLKPKCCPKEPARKIPRDVHEHARDVARSLTSTEGFEQSRRERKKIEMRYPRRLSAGCGSAWADHETSFSFHCISRSRFSTNTTRSACIRISR
jgi:Transposase DDE domain